jgi:RHS repeat-associated protein
VTHTKTNVLQYNEYYPFGLQTSKSWTRENVQGNNYLYNEGNELNTGSGWYEMFYRGYDPALGRMLQVDPYASLYTSHTGYNYSLNNPVILNDPDGGRVAHPGNGHWSDGIGSLGWTLNGNDDENGYSGGGGRSANSATKYRDYFLMRGSAFAKKYGVHPSNVLIINGQVYQVNQNGKVEHNRGPSRVWNGKYGKAAKNVWKIVPKLATQTRLTKIYVRVETFDTSDFDLVDLFHDSHGGFPNGGRHDFSSDRLIPDETFNFSFDMEKNELGDIRFNHNTFPLLDPLLTPSNYLYSVENQIVGVLGIIHFTIRIYENSNGVLFETSIESSMKKWRWPRPTEMAARITISSDPIISYSTDAIIGAKSSKSSSIKQSVYINGKLGPTGLEKLRPE